MARHNQLTSDFGEDSRSRCRHLLQGACPGGRTGDGRVVAASYATADKEKAMPLVVIHLIEGVFDKSQKQDMIRRVTDTRWSPSRAKPCAAAPGFACTKSQAANGPLAESA